MRPNQQKNRSRNRNGGRKHINPLSRNYESNGPDVKVRGNASHVAEKYLQLARDAQSSGDSVMAENYLQHAEHYFRIVMAAQVQQGQREGFNQDVDLDDDDDFPPINDRFSSPERPEPVRQENFHQPQQQQPNSTAQAEGSESGDTRPAPAQGGEQGGFAAQGEGENGEPRRHRERRRRRNRGPGENGGQDGGDPAGAPQPDVGELPAFLTAGPAAAE